jgi:D-alanyl-D-alanine-carboxypeptidase/D-alanyl-D-alanine-endopeptidase
MILRLLAVTLIIGCAHSTPETPADAAGSSVDAAPSSDTARAGWAALESVLTARAAANGASQLGLVVWDRNDHKVYEHTIGGFTPGTRVAVASASKLVAGLVIFDVIRRGQLALDSTTGQVLGWTGPNAAITLRHLLSFTSGLPKSAPCTANPLIPLAMCAEAIGMMAPVAAPGTRFDYGSTHLHVAARMAEVVTGKSWDQLFTETLRAPLGLPTEVAYFTFPRMAIGRINPLIAGGLRASMDEYAGFLGLAFHEGTLGAITVGTPALFAEQAREPFPGVTVGFTPWAANRYGLASWLMCQTPATGCAALASPGAFGFTPWYDRDAGYYAILGMELPRDTGDEGVVAFAVNLMVELAPMIGPLVRP